MHLINLLTFSWHPMGYVAGYWLRAALLGSLPSVEAEKTHIWTCTQMIQTWRPWDCYGRSHGGLVTSSLAGDAESPWISFQSVWNAVFGKMLHQLPRLSLVISQAATVATPSEIVSLHLKSVYGMKWNNTHDMFGCFILHESHKLRCSWTRGLMWTSLATTLARRWCFVALMVSLTTGIFAPPTSTSCLSASNGIIAGPKNYKSRLGYFRHI